MVPQRNVLYLPRNDCSSIISLYIKFFFPKFIERKFLNCYGNEGEVEWMKENIGGGYAMGIDNERENAYSQPHFEALSMLSTKSRNLFFDKHPL